MADNITYADKEQGVVSAFPTNQKWRYEDANEVKDVINNHATEIEVNTVDIADIQAELLTLPTINNLIVVKSLSDLPSPISNVITLNTDNVSYQIVGLIDLEGDRIEITGEAVKIFGINAGSDGFYRSDNSTTPMFTVVNKDITISTLQLVTSNGYFIDYTGSSAETVFIEKTAFISEFETSNIGVNVNNANTIVIRLCRFVNTANCIKLNGTATDVLIDSVVFQNVSGIAIDFNGSTTYAAALDKCTGILTTTGVFINIAASSANIASGGLGTITNNKVDISAGGTASVNYSPLDLLWSVTGNNNIITSDRLQPNGWGFYSDSNASTLVATSTPIQLSIDSLGTTTDENYLPKVIRGVASLWNSTDDCFEPITIGDSFDLRIQIEITNTSGNPTRLNMVLDIGDTPDGTGGTGSIIIAEDSKTLKSGTPQKHIFTYPGFSLTAFKANCGSFWFTADSGTVDIDERSILITRTSSGAS